MPLMKACNCLRTAWATQATARAVTSIGATTPSATKRAAFLQVASYAMILLSIVILSQFVGPAAS